MKVTNIHRYHEQLVEKLDLIEELGKDANSVVVIFESLPLEVPTYTIIAEFPITNKTVKSPVQEEKTIAFINVGDYYYTIDDDLAVVEFMFDNDSIDQYNLKNNNIFGTREECTEYANKIRELFSSRPVKYKSLQEEGNA